MKNILFTLAAFFFIYNNATGQNNWHSVPGTSSSQRIDDIYFVNNSLGFFGSNNWSGVPGIFKTTDGGDTWNLIYPDTSSHIRSIEFINDTIGFYGLLSGAGSTPGSLYRTTDGGYHWNRITNMGMLLYDGICGIAHYGNSVVAVGTYSTPARFYHSVDAGVTWTNQDLSAYASGLVDCYMISNDTIIVSGIADAANQHKATILKSVDGGLTWQRVFLASASTTYCWKMFFRPNGLGLASIEMTNAVARTTDYGSTWTEIAINNVPGYDFGAVGLLNDTLGYMTSQSNINYNGTWITHDGGLTWDTVTTVMECGDRMTVIDSVTAFISGLSIYKYTPGTIGIALNNISSAMHKINVYPNPASDHMRIGAIADVNTFGMIDILDEKGNIVKHICKQPFAQGQFYFNVDITTLSEGTYTVLWRTNQRFLTRSFVVAEP